VLSQLATSLLTTTRLKEEQLLSSSYSCLSINEFCSLTARNTNEGTARALSIGWTIDPDNKQFLIAPPITNQRNNKQFNLSHENIDRLTSYITHLEKAQ